MSFLQQGVSRTLGRSVLHNTRHSTRSRTLFTKTTSAPRSPLRTSLYATAFVVSTGLFAVYYFDARSAVHRYVLTPVLRYTLDPETGHKLSVKVLRSGLGPKDPVVDDARLKFELWGDEVTNPVGVAAGFDKDGEAIDGLFDLGFSWVEIGSVTPKPQPGNPRPRVFHLPEDSGLINRYGFPSQGHASVLSRLRARLPTFISGPEPASLREGSVLAVNLGKNKESPVDSVDDYVAGVRTFGTYSDVLVVNISSPNTPGLRGLQNRDHLKGLLESVVKARDELTPSVVTFRKPKLVLKIAPDLDEAQLVDMAEVIRGSNIDGVIVSNTTIQRPSHLINHNKHELGGLSGAPVKPYSLKAVRTLRKNLPASIPIIGCGGIATGADVLEFANAGASMVQLYTSFGYDGVGTCRRVKDQLVEELSKTGTTWSAVTKKAIDELSWKEPPKEEKKESTVSQLISEAKELKDLLDKLGEKMGQDASHPPSPVTDRETEGAAQEIVA
ncbi:Dihydroorotate dehydrogenase-domain-containing protein [Crucibulum laeve]|uniref:Dihydroorotate dehydrogenase (quinone), mitochondrial n=1 Tax=Crucibulum laeve TaxID=68775 RepID=A0A5C3MFQ2_9AGAR|nr:Dihydroorotate dehydrogenase-domain-containing protein [Crucibulum laeve]